MSTICKDCGIDAWEQWDERGQRYVHEDFYVHNELWDVVCPDDLVEEFEDGRNGTYVLCIGCFEQRLGRALTRRDFKADAPPDDNWFWSEVVGRPPSDRFLARWGAMP